MPVSMTSTTINVVGVGLEEFSMLKKEFMYGN
jgi:hypothetical protein